MGLLSRLWNLNTRGCSLQDPLKTMIDSNKYKTMDVIGYLKVRMLNRWSGEITLDALVESDQAVKSENDVRPYTVVCGSYSDKNDNVYLQKEVSLKKRALADVLQPALCCCTFSTGIRCSVAPFWTSNCIRVLTRRLRHI